MQKNRGITNYFLDRFKILLDYYGNVATIYHLILTFYSKIGNVTKRMVF